jgi:hypothetical protein
MAGFMSNGTDVVPVGRYTQEEREAIHLLFLNGELSEADYRAYLADAREYLNR